MARQRFVTPTTVRLEISDGDFIEVKERLDYGEAQALTAAGMRQSGSMLNGQADMMLDLVAYKVARMLTYIVEWSFADATGRVVPISREAIKALDPATAAEVEAALDAHIAAMDANPT